MGDA
jgi:hypothetical protein